MVVIVPCDDDDDDGCGPAESCAIWLSLSHLAIPHSFWLDERDELDGLDALVDGDVGKVKVGALGDGDVGDVPVEVDALGDSGGVGKVDPAF